MGKKKHLLMRTPVPKCFRIVMALDFPVAVVAVLIALMDFAFVFTEQIRNFIRTPVK
jgi:hypothetical protein